LLMYMGTKPEENFSNTLICVSKAEPRLTMK
jgi:hypothetical protein